MPIPTLIAVMVAVTMFRVKPSKYMVPKIQPVISTIGWELPAIFSGEAITAIVLALPTTGTLFYSALITQDMYLAASIVLILGFLVVVGTLISDFLLVLVDPRIHLEKGN